MSQEEGEFWTGLELARWRAGWGLTLAGVLVMVVSIAWVDLPWLNTLLGGLAGLLLWVGGICIEG